MYKLLAVIMLLPSFNSFSQNLKTDRPDQSDGAIVMDQKKLQIESSFYYTSFEKEHNAFISSSLIRYGLLKNVELRALVEQGKNRNVFLEEAAHAQFPLAISAKVMVIKDNKIVPDISIVSYLQIPVTNGSQPHIWSPGLLLIAEKEWNDFTITSNFGAKQEVFSSTWNWQSTADLKYELSDHWQIFAEYFAQYGDTAPFHNVDAGLLYFPCSRWMIHMAAGTTISHDPSNKFINTGFAYRLH